jgi:hypothetical protein
MPGVGSAPVPGLLRWVRRCGLSETRSRSNPGSQCRVGGLGSRAAPRVNALDLMASWNGLGSRPGVAARNFDSESRFATVTRILSRGALSIATRMLRRGEAFWWAEEAGANLLHPDDLSDVELRGLDLPPLHCVAARRRTAEWGVGSSPHGCGRSGKGRVCVCTRMRMRGALTSGSNAYRRSPVLFHDDFAHTLAALSVLDESRSDCG